MVFLNSRCDPRFRLSRIINTTELQLFVQPVRIDVGTYGCRQFGRGFALC